MYWHNKIRIGKKKQIQGTTMGQIRGHHVYRVIYSPPLLAALLLQ